MDKCWSSDIPTDIRKKCDSCFQALKNCVNQFILSGNSPGSLKLANISQVSKAKDPLYKTYYRPHLSKIFKRSIFDKFSRHARKTLRKLLCGFKKFMACHMLCLDYFSHGKGHLTAQDMFAQCSWIYQKPIPASSWFTYC